MNLPNIGTIGSAIASAASRNAAGSSGSETAKQFASGLGDHANGGLESALQMANGATLAGMGGLPHAGSSTLGGYGGHGPVVRGGGGKDDEIKALEQAIRQAEQKDPSDPKVAGLKQALGDLVEQQAEGSGGSPPSGGIGLDGRKEIREGESEMQKGKDEIAQGKQEMGDALKDMKNGDMSGALKAFDEAGANEKSGHQDMRAGRRDVREGFKELSEAHQGFGAPFGGGVLAKGLPPKGLMSDPLPKEQTLSGVAGRPGGGSPV